MYRNLSPLLSQKPNYVPIVDWTVASTESVRNGGAIEATQAISFLRRVATRRLGLLRPASHPEEVEAGPYSVV